MLHVDVNMYRNIPDGGGQAMSPRKSQPLQQCSDGDGNLERRAGFVLAGGPGAALLEPVEAVFDDVTVPVDQLVERQRATAAKSTTAAAFLLFWAFRDGVGDAAAADPAACCGPLSAMT